MASTSKEEASQVSDHLTRLKSQPLHHQEETVSNSITPRPGCKPWCVQHDPDGDICVGENVEAGDHTVGLSYQADEGVQVHVDQFDATVPLAESGELARAIHAQFARAHAKPDREIPEAWEKDATAAGERAAMAVKFEYLATMDAFDNDRQSDAPAYWLASDPCPEWCANQSLHRSDDEPCDRAHDGVTFAISLNSMSPVVIQDPAARFGAPELRFMLTKKFREVEPRVWINDDADKVDKYATLDEIEQIAHTLLALVREGRGVEWGKIVPLQHGPSACDDSTCMCHEQLFAPTCGG